VVLTRVVTPSLGNTQVLSESLALYADKLDTIGGDIRHILEMESQGQVLGEDSVSKANRDQFEGACELFGNWAIALEYAEVRIKRNRSQSIFPNVGIQRIRGRVGRLNSVRAGQVRKTDYKLYRAGIVAFGS